MEQKKIQEKTLENASAAAIHKNIYAYPFSLSSFSYQESTIQEFEGAMLRILLSLYNAINSSMLTIARSVTEYKESSYRKRLRE